MTKLTAHNTAAAGAAPPPPPPLGRGAGDVTLRATNLHKTYRLGRVQVPVLKGVDIEVRRGEWMAVLGASGSGKSTLLHLLGGLDRPDAWKGEESKCPKCGYDIALEKKRCPECGRGIGTVIEYEGADVNAMSQRAIDRYRNRQVGFVFQFYHLLPELTVAQNVMVPAMVKFGLGFPAQRSKVHARAEHLLKTFGLSHRLRHRPAELSGGERQRVAIARALINDPPLLLADEPTGNLDHKTGQAILDELTAHRKESGRTILMVTHDLEVASRADRVIRLADGIVERADANPAGAGG